MVRRPSDGERERLRRHYEVERELADRLRRAEPERRRTLYREVYDELHQRVELVGNAEAQAAQVALLLRLLDPFLGDRRSFLELGAGSCELSLAVARRVDRVWAVDAVDPGIDRATAPPGFVFVASDGLDTAVPKGEVELAMSCHFIEHLHPDDLRGHLAQVRELLEAGGRYVVVTPNRLYGPHDISRHFSDRPEGLHLREYSHLELGRELRAAGFDPVQVIGQIGEPPRSRAWRRVAVAERLLDALPVRLRRRCLEWAPRQAPFRPLEQVKIVATRPAAGVG